MKKLLFICATVFILGIAASCSKEYTCVCYFPDDTLPAYHKVEASSSSSAEDKCTEIGRTAYAHIGPDYNVNCYIQ